MLSMAWKSSPCHAAPCTYADARIDCAADVASAAPRETMVPDTQLAQLDVLATWPHTHGDVHTQKIE